MNVLKKSQIKAICLSSVCLVLGVLFCVLPTKMLDTIETLLSVALIIYGLINILIYCLANSELRESIRMLKGALATGFALLIIFVNSIFIICLGLFIVLSGVVYITSAVKDKKQGDKKWWTGLIFGIVITLLGVTVVILCNTKIAESIVMIIFGLALIADGVLRLIYVFAARKAFHNILKNKTTSKDETIEPEYEVKPAEDDLNKNSQKSEENKEKSTKIQQKIEENAKNVSDDLEETDDDGVEGFV